MIMMAIIIIKGFHRAQDRPTATNVLCRQRKCLQLYTSVFSCVLKVLSETSVDRSAAGKLLLNTYRSRWRVPGQDANPYRYVILTKRYGEKVLSVKGY